MADHTDVVVRWSEPYGDGGYGQPAAFWWPANVPLPQVDDELAAPGPSPLPGPVRIIGRRWVVGLIGQLPGVLLELYAEVIR